MTFSIHILTSPQYILMMFLCFQIPYNNTSNIQKLMLLIQDMVAYSNKIFKIKSPLSIFIMEYGVDHTKIIQRSKKRFWQLFYSFKNFKKMFLTRNFFFVLIAKVQNKFFKRMFKILFQNKYLQGGRLSCQFLTLKLNL